MHAHASTSTVNLTGHFLIAMPAMADKNFARTLTLVCEHNDQGALGVIVNRPIDMSLEDLFERIELTLESPRFQGQPVYFGGPVQTDRGFVLHRPVGEWQSTIDVGNGLGLTSSRDVLQALGSEIEPDDVLVTLGYAGWQAGQIEWEMAQNAWLTVPADSGIIFDLPPEERLVAAMQLLGVDFASLSDVAGHA
ncbi:hypothetical protein BSY238_2207 [Methyloversatilis sp. RAC08]|jgi:putative transcriptional regulator|uniref:YqgE/AlgH family protein n=1 Tax=Methyloversatilis sp. RAC08 TaxID=1842540 RepID=UPI00083CE88A|nr:YqgE/AlgH family protein [Methyloversatilis sp. RAC08]AOF82977.1 hypothetical protein BSY238_2207 [Methyloversatilis sp. RAC08]